MTTAKMPSAKVQKVVYHLIVIFEDFASDSAIGYMRNLPSAPDMYLEAARPATRPKTTQSRSELPPRRLFPCTPPAASPATYKPGKAFPPLMHSPSTVVWRPPMQ